MSISRRTAHVTELYQHYLSNPDANSFAKRVRERYEPATLERLAAHGERTTRRAAVQALGLVGDYSNNAVLGRALVDDDRMVRSLAEAAIRSVWRRDGTPAQRKLLGLIVRLNTARQHDDAIRRATELIEACPWFAEAWNQRAIAHYNKNHFSESIGDCHQALEINPYHFDAATGMGQCFLQIEDQHSALDSFRRALRLNPGLEGVRAGIEYLERALRKKRKS